MTAGAGMLAPTNPIGSPGARPSRASGIEYSYILWSKEPSSLQPKPHAPASPAWSGSRTRIAGV